MKKNYIVNILVVLYIHVELNIYKLVQDQLYLIYFVNARKENMEKLQF